jgi:hypothetical protein
MRFKKSKPLSHKPCPAAPPAPALIQPDILLTANAMVLTTEDKSKFITLYHEYLDEYRPQGRTQHDLVEDMVCARWRQRRCAIIQTAIMNLTMDRRAAAVAAEFASLDNAIRTALAYIDQNGIDSALTRITREEARHNRTFNRAFKLLRELQNEKLPNEPEPGLTPVIPINSNDPQPELATGPRATDQNGKLPNEPNTGLSAVISPIAAKTGHRPLATGHCP